MAGFIQSAVSKVFGPGYNWIPPDMAPMPPNPEFLARLSLADGANNARLLDYAKFERYYDGDQPDMLPTSNKKRLELYCGFRANIVQVVCDALAERLTVNGFNAANATKPLTDRMSEIWQRNRMDDDQATAHSEAVLLGDTYIVVDWDEDRKLPRLNWNPAESISVCYTDAANRCLSYAVKRWDSADMGTRRKNVYFPDRIERYVTTVGKDGQYKEADWRQFTGDGQPAVIDWTDRQGKPLGIAVIPFRNRAKGRAYGRSEAANVLPLQDAINKTLVDLLLVLDTQGWPQRWVRGNSPPGGWQVGPGRVWESNHPDFAAGVLDAGDPGALMGPLGGLIKTAASVSRTPFHLLQLDDRIPSGEALKTAEIPLIQKARDRQKAFGNSWEDVMMLALRIDNNWGKASWDVDNLILQTEWADPEQRNDLAHMQAVSTAAPWLPQPEIWRKMGYNAEEIARLQVEWDAEQEKKGSIGANLIDAFNSGKAQDTGNTMPMMNGATPQNDPGGQANTRNPDR